jgi:phosphoglycerol transferase MdoB-like AlkP superfamily enzyme
MLKEIRQSFRIFDVSVIDVVLTVLAALAISKWKRINFWVVLASLFVLGIVTHRALKIRTKVDTILFPEDYHPDLDE